MCINWSIVTRAHVPRQVAKCASMCMDDDDGFTDIGVGRYSCYCGQSPTAAPTVDESKCSSGCRGDGSVICGGYLAGPGDYYSVYSLPRTAQQLVDIPNPLNAPDPLFLGGHLFNGGYSGQEQGGGFVGNIADLAIFDRVLEDKEVDCLFRETERTLGSCR